MTSQPASPGSSAAAIPANRYDGRVIVSAPDHAVIACPALGGAVRVEPGIAARSGADVRIAIGEDAIEMKPHPPQDDGRDTVPATLARVRRFGTLARYDLTLESGASMHVVRHTAGTGDVVAVGERMWLMWEGRSVIVAVS